MTENTAEQPEQANGSPNTGLSPTLPEFDRNAPPTPSDLPPLMNTKQIAFVLGISDANARTAGNRGRFGPATKISEQNFYRREGVVQDWHKRYTPKTQMQPRPEQAEQQNGSVNVSAELVHLLQEAMRQGGGQSEQNAQLVQVVSSQQQQIAELSAELKAEREHSRKRQEAMEKAQADAANKPRTLWRKLFGG